MTEPTRKQVLADARRLHRSMVFAIAAPNTKLEEAQGLEKAREQLAGIIADLERSR